MIKEILPIRERQWLRDTRHNTESPIKNQCSGVSKYMIYKDLNPKKFVASLRHPKGHLVCVSQTAAFLQYPANYFWNILMSSVRAWCSNGGGGGGHKIECIKYTKKVRPLVHQKKHLATIFIIVTHDTLRDSKEINKERWLL